MEKLTVISGREFKELNRDLKFYKITNRREKHHGFQYKTGLNIDINLFNPEGECKSGGLYFSDEKNITSFLDIGIYFREVTICDDSKIYIEHGKYKTYKFILGERHYIEDLIKLLSIKSSDMRHKCHCYRLYGWTF